MAADMGVLSLSLRSVGHPDGWVDPTDQTHTWDVEAAKGILYGPPSDRSRPGAPQRRIIVMRGSIISEVSMGARPIGGATNP